MSQLPHLDLTARLALAWFALACLDVLTGWLAAVITSTLSSRVSWRGVMRKWLTAAVIVVVGIVNAIAPSPLDGFPLLLPALVGFIGSEVFSIFENAKRAGITIPGVTSRLGDKPDESHASGSSGRAPDLSGDHR